MAEEPASTATPWWGRLLGGAGMLLALPSLIFPFAESAILRRPHVPQGGTALDAVYFLTGLLAPFLTPAAVLCALIVLVAPRIRIGLRVATAAIAAASVPATLHILRAFTAQFR